MSQEKIHVKLIFRVDASAVPEGCAARLLRVRNAQPSTHLPPEFSGDDVGPVQ